jgi:signal transduction histidine kinase
MTQLDASAAAAELTVENERLRGELRARLEELRNCRRRMVEAIQFERRRIERDLHDGTSGGWCLWRCR